tara:strand:+ start:30 stop:548 length:519 start_codon:yes stop_codon:yes gene_type:complete
MRTKFFPILITIIFLIIFFIFYKGLQNSNIYIPKTNVEKNIPSFQVKVFDSENEINSEEIFKNDKFYLMNIWASWCVPCRDEHSFLIELANQKNLEIIGLNYKDKTKNAKNFLKEFNSPYQIILSDEDGTIAIEWGAYGVPETFLVHNKKIIKKIVGPLNANLLIELRSLTQ